MAPLLHATVRSSGYGAVDVLRQVAVDVDRGEIVVVLGSNGAGKTTLLRTLSRVIVDADADVALGGEDVSRLPAWKRVRAGLVHVPEGRRVFADLSVLENLAVPSRARRSSAAEQSAALERVFGVFPVLADRRDQRAASLSGGQQQMLAIGRGLMAAPKVLMVDEASLGLAPSTTDEVFEALVRLAADGLGVLLVEQNARASLRIARRAYVLERGEVAVAGHSAELLHDERVTTTYLGGPVTNRQDNRC